MESPPLASSYWCYRCSRLVRVWARYGIVCPECEGGFIEEVGNPSRYNSIARFPPAAMDMPGNRPISHRSTVSGVRRSGGGRSPYNPVIVLRGPSSSDGGANDAGGYRRNLELYYDDGAGSGLRPLPPPISEFLMGSGFDRLLDQLSQIEINGFGRCQHPPASKAALESMPTIDIAPSHVASESHCTVCMEPFDLGSEAREMPCKHIYHSRCIVHWLSMRNSCPICRLELPGADSRGRRSLEYERLLDGQSQASTEEETIGLTIWRLPGGSFAIGRFTGVIRAGNEQELPVVYTELDGDFATVDSPRRVSWESRDQSSRDQSSRDQSSSDQSSRDQSSRDQSSRDQSSRQRSGIGRVFRNFFSSIGRLRSSSSSSRSISDSTSRQSLSTDFVRGRASGGRLAALQLDEQ